MARILIVDDEEGIRSLLKRLLTLHGHTTDAAADGGEAIDRLQAKKYDLMITDNNMPKITGPQAIAVIRSSEKFRRLKIIMLTVASQTKDVDEVYGMGIDGYLLKPINVHKLLGTVATALNAA